MGAKSNLLIYLEKKIISKADFYRETGLSNGFLDKNEHISSRNIEIIISHFPDISLEWLIFGNGEMLKDANQTVQDFPHTSESCDTQTAENQYKDIKKSNICDFENEKISCVACKDKERIIASQQETIELQREVIGMLRTENISDVKNADVR